jgi:hypothetical protein
MRLRGLVYLRCAGQLWRACRNAARTPSAPQALGSIRLQYQRSRSAGWGVGLCGVAASKSVAEEVSVDVGDVGAVLGGDRREFGVELGEEVDDGGPWWQADAGGVAGAVAGVVCRASRFLAGPVSCGADHRGV